MEELIALGMHLKLIKGKKVMNCAESKTIKMWGHYEQPSGPGYFIFAVITLAKKEF